MPRNTEGWRRGAPRRAPRRRRRSPRAGAPDRPRGDRVLVAARSTTRRDAMRWYVHFGHHSVSRSDSVRVVRRVGRPQASRVDTGGDGVWRGGKHAADEGSRSSPASTRRSTSAVRSTQHSSSRAARAEALEAAHAWRGGGTVRSSPRTSSTDGHRRRLAMVPQLAQPVRPGGVVRGDDEVLRHRHRDRRQARVAGSSTWQ